MFKTIIKYGFLLGLLLSGAACFAQSDFREGYVVLPAGDTVRGEIEHRTAQVRAQRVRIRTTGGTKEYTPSELRGYGGTGSAIYESGRLPGYPPSLAFVEVLVRSDISLYFMAGNNQRPRFYLKKQQDSILTELVSRDTTVERLVNGSVAKVKIADTRYRITMHQAFGECEAVQGLIDQTAFSESGLRRVFREYAACKSGAGKQAAAFEGAQQLTQLQFQLFAGVQQTQLRFKEDSYWRGEKFTGSTSPVLGVGLVVHPARFSEKLSILPQLYWAQVAIEEVFFIPPSATTQPAFTSTRSSVFYKVQSIRLPVVVRYSFGNGSRVRAYLQVGPEIAQQLSGRGYAEVEETAISGSVKRYTAPAFGKLRQTAFGATGSLGCLLPATGVGVELRYGWLDGISQSPTLSARPQMISALLNYTFGK